MNQRWQYGNYTFRLNPSGNNSKFDVVGDDVRTLTGAVISQPTGVTESMSVEAVFYQPRTRIYNERSLPFTNFIACDGIECRSMNVDTMTITVYSDDFTTTASTIQIAGVLGVPTGFAVSDGYYFVSSRTSTDEKVYRFYGNSLSETYTISRPTGTSTSRGVAIIGNYIYLLWDNNTISAYDSTRLGAYVKTINLPHVAGFTSIDSDGEFLLVGNYDYDNNVISHIDPSSGMIVNSITTDGINEVDDVSHNGNLYFVLNREKGTIQSIRGNTVNLDLFKFHRETAKGYVRLTDDRGVSSMVGVTSVSATRRSNYEVAYDVSISFQRVNRGV